MWQRLAIRAFVRDLLAGDPVAIGLLLAILAALALLGVWSYFILRRRRLDEAKRQAKFDENRKLADAMVKKMKRNMES